MQLKELTQMLQIEENYDPLSAARGALFGALIGAFCWSLAGILWLILR